MVAYLLPRGLEPVDRMGQLGDDLDERTPHLGGPLPLAEAVLGRAVQDRSRRVRRLPGAPVRSIPLLLTAHCGDGAEELTGHDDSRVEPALAVEVGLVAQHHPVHARRSRG
jgi:hypothetical protein